MSFRITGFDITFLTAKSTSLCEIVVVLSEVVDSAKSWGPEFRLLYSVLQYMIVWRFSRLLKGPLMLSVAVKFWVLEMSFEDAGVVKSNPSRSIDDHKPEWSELHRAIESLILSILYPVNPTVSTSAAAIQLSPFYTLLKEPLTVGGQANRNVDLVLYTSITSRSIKVQAWLPSWLAQSTWNGPSYAPAYSSSISALLRGHKPAAISMGRDALPLQCCL